MEPNRMFTVGLVPSRQLISLLTDDEGNYRDVPEGETVVPLVKIPKPTQGAWEPSVVWFDDRVERQWVAGTPAPAPTFTAEQWVAQSLTPLQVAALSEFRAALLQAGKPLGANMTALKAWLEVMMAESVYPTPRTFEAAPCGYEDAASEALATLQQ